LCGKLSYKLDKLNLFESSYSIRISILRKVVGDSVFDGQLIERLVVSPVRVKPYKAS
jgi:hypothetical protein